MPSSTTRTYYWCFLISKVRNKSGEDLLSSGILLKCHSKCTEPLICCVYDEMKLTTAQHRMGIFILQHYSGPNIKILLVTLCHCLLEHNLQGYLYKNTVLHNQLFGKYSFVFTVHIESHTTFMEKSVKKGQVI